MALLAVARVIASFPLLRTNVGVSQALPVEALWDGVQVDRVFGESCGLTVSQVR